VLLHGSYRFGFSSLLKPLQEFTQTKDFSIIRLLLDARFKVKNMLDRRF